MRSLLVIIGSKAKTAMETGLTERKPAARSHQSALDCGVERT